MFNESIKVGGMGTARPQKTSMGKIKFLFLLLLLSPIYAHSQTDDGYSTKRKYFNIGFVNTTMEQDGMPKIKSNYGASLTFGKTFYLHKKAVANLIKFGIDATWFDLTYTNYDVKHITYWEEKKYQVHEAEFAMQVGPSLTVNPISKLNILGYFRYAPSYSCYYANEKFGGSYASYWVGGCSVSYSVIGLGIEARFGNGKFNNVLPIGSDESSGRTPVHTSGFRTYLTFKF